MISNNLYCPFSNALCRIDCAMIVESMDKKTYGGCEHTTRHFACSIATQAQGKVLGAALQDCFYDETSKEIDY